MKVSLLAAVLSIVASAIVIPVIPYTDFYKDPQTSQIRVGKLGCKSIAQMGCICLILHAENLNFSLTWVLSTTTTIIMIYVI